MATVNLGSVTFNDSLLPDLRLVFGGATDAESAANARAWVRTRLREYVIRTRLALKQHEDTETFRLSSEAEEDRLETGWPP